MAVTNLVTAYQNNDIAEFEKILRQQRESIMEDAFIREHIEALLRNIRTEVLVKLLRPYTRVRLPFISQQLNLEPAEVESLLVSCILDQVVQGRIDQENQVLILNREPESEERYLALEKLSVRLKSLHTSIASAAWNPSPPLR